MALRRAHNDEKRDDLEKAASVSRPQKNGEKIMMKRIALVTAAASMFVLASVDAEARRGRGNGPHDRDRGAKVLRHADQLGLSDAQIQQIRSIHEAARAQAQPLREDVDQMRSERRELMRAPVIDEAAVMQLIDEMTPVQVALRKIRARTQIEVLGVLTPEQRDMFQQFRQERREMRDARRGMFKAWKADKIKKADK